jgi:hypothetical protein
MAELGKILYWVLTKHHFNITKHKTGKINTWVLTKSGPEAKSKAIMKQLGTDYWLKVNKITRNYSIRGDVSGW